MSDGFPKVDQPRDWPEWAGSWDDAPVWMHEMVYRAFMCSPISMDDIVRASRWFRERDPANKP